MVQAILRRPDVERATGLSRSTIYELIARGDFPKPIKLSARAVGWPENTIREWQESRKAARNRGSTNKAA
jgi:prophage regulatory protein